MSRALSAWIFLTGLAGLAISAAGYLLGFPAVAPIFMASAMVVLASGAASAFRREGGAGLEDLLTMVVAFCAVIWLAWRTIH